MKTLTRQIAGLLGWSGALVIAIFWEEQYVRLTLGLLCGLFIFRILAGVWVKQKKEELYG